MKILGHCHGAPLLQPSAHASEAGGGGGTITLYMIFPGMHVSVVNSYAATSDDVPVSIVSSVDFPAGRRDAQRVQS